ncbi:response regulator receiver protein [Methylobacterium radiotolerans]|nr:response regulator receiver protein [Methylobacterium radiotolerans]KTS49516.1 response regulator receiver protein [Methylobacterium radiotolerans]
MSRPVAVLAEDEPLIRLEAADMLDDLGFEVLQAGSAMDALELLESRNGAALLYTDIDMPGRINGQDLAHEVVARWPSIAIIVCSARSTEDAALLPRDAFFIGKLCAEWVVRDALATLQLH